MPKSYTQTERTKIMNQLKAAAMESMLQKGIKKTTVDELVQKVHIPKGTFYLFYESKEMLLYDAFLQTDEQMHGLLAEQMQQLVADFSPESLTELLVFFFQMGFQTGILQLMLSGELEILIRKLPDEIVAAHIEKDDDFLQVFARLFPHLTKQELAAYSAAFRGIFFTAGHQREIGECYEEALHLLVRGLVLQMWSSFT